MVKSFKIIKQESSVTGTILDYSSTSLHPLLFIFFIDSLHSDQLVFILLKISKEVS